MALVTFDGVNRIIEVNTGVTFLDAQIDLYSDWKEWVQTGAGAPYYAAFATSGGFEIDATTDTGRVYFLINGWTIRPHDATHELEIRGNLYAEAGQPIFVPPLGSFTVAAIVTRAIDSLEKETRAALSTEQSEQLLDIFRVLGLDPLTPLIVSPTSRTAGAELVQTVESDEPVEDSVTVTRQ